MSLGLLAIQGIIRATEDSLENFFLCEGLNKKQVALFGLFAGVIGTLIAQRVLEFSKLAEKVELLKTSMYDVQQKYLSKISDKKTWEEIDWGQMDSQSEAVGEMSKEYCPLFKKGYSIYRHSQYLAVLSDVITRVFINILKPQLLGNVVELPWGQLAQLTVWHYLTFGYIQITAADSQPHLVFWKDKCSGAH